MWTGAKRSFADVVANLPGQIGMIECDGIQFTRLKIDGDGNCYFRCLAVWILDDVELHSQLRQMVVEYALENWQEVRNMAGLCYPNCKTADDYLRYMGENGVYAGQFEIIMTARLLQRPVFVYNKQSNSFIIESPSNADQNSPILLHYDYQAQHYEVLKEARDHIIKFLTVHCPLKPKTQVVNKMQICPVVVVMTPVQIMMNAQPHVNSPLYLNPNYLMIVQQIRTIVIKIPVVSLNVSRWKCQPTHVQGKMM